MTIKVATMMIRAMTILSIGNLMAIGGTGLGGAGGTEGTHGPPTSLIIASPIEYAKVSIMVALPVEYEPSFITVACPSELSSP